MIDFPTWFNAGCYGGLACCMCAIAANALYTSLRRKGTTRQLAGAIVVCVISALLLLPALVWYDLRFQTQGALLSFAEIEVALGYVALCGWLLPLGVTAAYCLYTLPRVSSASMELPRQKRSTRVNPSAIPQLPHRQPGRLAPFVFSDDTPWGWLEYRGGNFQGQRLALKRVVESIGRDEDNDIWIDDDMASRHHAELAWDQGKVYVTDCNSLNGVLLNGQRIRTSMQVEANDLLEIGSQRFIFIMAEQVEAPSELSDPLAHHQWHSSEESLTGRVNTPPPPTQPMLGNPISSPSLPPLQANPPASGATYPPAQSNLPVSSALHPPLFAGLPSSSLDGATGSAGGLMSRQWGDTARIDQATPPPQLRQQGGAMIIRNGPMQGQSFLLDRPVVTVGRDTGCDVALHDASVSRRHAQFLRQADGDYVQDLGSSNGTLVNNQPLLNPRLLQEGDLVCVGNIYLEYLPIQVARTIPLEYVITPQSFAGPPDGL